VVFVQVTVVPEGTESGAGAKQCASVPVQGESWIVTAWSAQAGGAALSAKATITRIRTRRILASQGRRSPANLPA
jgi:hypothetical protein